MGISEEENHANIFKNMFAPSVNLALAPNKNVLYRSANVFAAVITAALQCDYEPDLT